MQQIAEWLEKLGMSEYAQRFAENRIDFSVLPDLTDQDLEKPGVVLGDRCKILRAVANLEAWKNAPVATAVCTKLLRETLIAPLMLIAIAGTAVAGALEDAYSALNEGDYATALQLFRPLANEGNVAARKAVAIINDYCLNADKGNALAQFTLGFIYEFGCATGLCTRSHVVQLGCCSGYERRGGMERTLGGTYESRTDHGGAEAGA